MKAPIEWFCWDYEDNQVADALLIIFSPWLARCTYRGQSLAKMKEYARVYAEQGWRVTWIWKEAQNEVHEGAEDSGVTS